MSTRYITFAVEEFYHIYNRGVEKRIIYKDAQDYQRFVELLYVANTSESVDVRRIRNSNKTVYDWERTDLLVAIGAYCLMPNHFHIALTPLQDKGVSTFMNKLCTSYSMYFNKKYGRSGRLFEGTFKAKHVDSDEYLKYLFSYIHLNPTTLLQPDWKENEINDSEKAYNHAAMYKYSSLPDYLQSSRSESVIVDTAVFPTYFANAAEKKQELLDWLHYLEKDD